MNKSEAINDLALALAKFQGEVPVITFDSDVKVQTKTGGSYSFQYASLKAIKETCKPILLKNELAISQLVGQKELTTILMHSSGQYISDAMDLPLDDKSVNTKEGIIKVSLTPQEIGSIITYMKRYSYSSILGLVSDEDDDANIAEGNKVTKTDKKYPEDNRPWLTEKQYQSALKAIQERKPVNVKGEEITAEDYAKRLFAAYKMKKDYKQALEQELNSNFNKSVQR